VKYSALIPITQTSINFDDCQNLAEFAVRLLESYQISKDDRERITVLATLLAIRDHFPEFLEGWSLEQKAYLNSEIDKAPPQIIKLRRIAISLIAKAA
jgi:hypothetical protein